MADETHLRARRRKLPLLALAATAGFLVAYISFVRTIGAADPGETAPPDPPDGGVSVSLVGTSMVPERPAVEALVILEPDGTLLDRDGVLTEPVILQITPSLDREFVYRAGRHPDVRTVSLPLLGDLEEYPFDTYASQLRITASTADADGRLLERIPVVVATDLRQPGWTGWSSAGQGTEGVMVTGTVERATSTTAISLLLLTFMVALGVVAALVAIWVVSGVMEVQVGIASWLAALLFALIPLRNFLPGAPPVGAWIDVLVFFWVEVIIMASMLTVVVTLLITARRAARAPAQPGAEAEEGAEEVPPAITAAAQPGAGAAPAG